MRWGSGRVDGGDRSIGRRGGSSGYGGGGGGGGGLGGVGIGGLLGNGSLWRGEGGG